jgi:hypothetical protein
LQLAGHLFLGLVNARRGAHSAKGLTMLPIRYSMKNRVNGEAMEILGSGNWFEDGRMALNLTLSAIPPDWTGTIGPCICSGPGPGSHAGTKGASSGLIGFAPNGYKTETGTHRRATLWDENGEQIAKVSATGVYEKTASKFDFEIDVETETKAGSVISDLRSIDSYNFTITPNGKGKVIVVSMYGLSTFDGRKAYGATHINYEMINCDVELIDTVIGRNVIVVQQIDNAIQWITKQTTTPSQSLGIKDSVIKALS